MKQQSHLAVPPQLLEEILGYLNFSSGARNIPFLTALNALFEEIQKNNPLDPHRTVLERLRQALENLSLSSETFRQPNQARGVLQFVQDQLLPAYRDFHRDLLSYQSDLILFNSFFLGRVFEIVLSQGTHKEQPDILVPQIIEELNDLLGYRPIPILEGVEKHQPNPHEWVAPIPLYIKGVGAATGRYKEMVQHAMNILKGTGEDILRDACFDPDRIEELVLDPRAYDFDHPVNRRPNYHFGTWDLNTINQHGYYTRFVVHQVTIDGILQRYETAYTGESDVSNVSPEGILYETGAVLAGTMLMGSGICGEGPQTHDSSVSLASLMPVIAAYRDRFYENLIQRVDEGMQHRLEQERKRLHQPFGGARQDLNKRLAKRRADQLQRLHLARTFARMGHFEAAKRQTTIISVASARILCNIDCLITQAHFQADRGQIGEASALIPEMEELLHRGIACGALVDPWTIIGFGAQFTLFAALDNSVHDHRVDDLIHLLDDIFDLYSRLQKEAAASGNGELQADLSDRMSDLAGWWDQFGSTDVSSVEGFSGLAAWESAAKVATALAAWHKAGTAAGDVAFWSRHVQRFSSPKAFVLLGEALLDQRDPVASMSLMMHWLSQSETIPLSEGDYSFHSIALRWMESLWREPREGDLGSEKGGKPKSFLPMEPTKRWELTQKFFDYLEANADVYWSVPELDLDPMMFGDSGDGGHSRQRRKKKKGKGKGKGKKGKDGKPDSEHSGGGDYFGGGTALEEAYDDGGFDSEYEGDSQSEFGEEEDYLDRRGIDPTYSAAYEDVTFRDTAEDGNTENTLEGGPSFTQEKDDLELADETERISERLAFLVTMFKLWKFASGKSPLLSESERFGYSPGPEYEEYRIEVRNRLESWLSQATVIWQGLQDLLRRAAQYVVPPPRGTQESLMEYDHHRGTKEILLDRIVWSTVEAADTILFIQAVLGHETVMLKERESPKEKETWKEAVVTVLSSVFRGDAEGVRRHWAQMLRVFSRETLLYIPTSRGGDAAAIVECRCLQQVILRLLEYAPRLGLLIETFQLLETIQTMEQTRSLKPGAITEFDRLVETATRAITKCIAESSKHWRIAKEDVLKSNDHALVDYLERVIELLLNSWLSHSRQIRISPVESMTDRAIWNDVKAFIQKYGRDIFTLQFMGFGNLRAVLHQGVANYLHSLIKMSEDDEELEIGGTLIADLRNNRYSWDDAVFSLEVIFESVAENYSEYIDYNSTTTHSDKGDRLYMLLDMLRVLTGYERISWNLKPVYWVHDTMIRARCTHAADLWERAVARRSYNAAEEHLRHYARLNEKYGMWLPSVHERLQERFVRPLQIDRMCGLVGASVREAREDGPKTTFIELEKQIEMFAREPMGVGFEMPEWLSALQEEVMSTRVDSKEEEAGEESFNPTPNVLQVRLTRRELDRQIDSWSERAKFA